MGFKIWGLLFSIALIIGGLSGEYVLRFTESSNALVIAGVLFLIWDIIDISRYVANKKKAETAAIELAGISAECYDTLIAEECELLPELRDVDVYLFTRMANKTAYPLSLNGNSYGEISPKNRPVKLQTDRVKNVLVVEGAEGQKNYFFFEVTDEAGQIPYPKPGIQIYANEKFSAPQKILQMVATANSGLTKIDP
jgi:hypothetical protein